MLDKIYTGLSNPNIAFIKYWGKRNAELTLPNNSSISMSLDDTLSTKTSVVFSDKIQEDRVFINGKLQDLKNKATYERLRVIKQLREKANVNAHALIVSQNSFPTSAGLASSASGVSALVFVAAHALELEMDAREMSTIARLGSGSAARSMYGGIVVWRKGTRDDGNDSYAEQLVPENYWPELIDVIGISSAESKKISSSAGHSRAYTSPLYKTRIGLAEEGVEAAKKAILKKDFGSLAETIMRESNNMHAIMLDSWPPVFYLNDLSKQVINAVHELNGANGSIIAAYTFDAGPNPHIITTRKHEKEIIAMLEAILGKGNRIVAGQGKGPRMLENGHLIDSNSFEPIFQ